MALQPAEMRMVRWMCNVKVKNLVPRGTDGRLLLSGFQALLPCPIVNGRGDRPRKVQFSELQKPRDLDLDLGSGHMAYRHASVIDPYLHTKFH